MLIKNYVLVEGANDVFCVTARKNTLMVTTDVAANSVVKLVIEGFNKPYTVPLFMARQTALGNIFMGDVVFMDNQIQYIKEHDGKVYDCHFVIGTAKVEGTFKLTITPHAVMEYGKMANNISGLVKKMSLLQAEVYAMQKDYPDFKKSIVDLPKGVCPVATGIGSEYKWDYPLIDVQTAVKGLAKAVADLADQNAELVKKVNELEKKINDHVYEEYQL